MNFNNIFKSLSVIVFVFLMCGYSFAEEKPMVDKYIITGSIQDYKGSELPENQQAEKAWSLYGVDSFRVLSTSREQASIGLYDENQEKIGTLDFKTIDSFETITLKLLSGIDITFFTNTAMTFFRIKDNISGESHNSSYNPELSKWVENEEAELFFETNKDILILMLSIHVKFMKNSKPNINSLDTSTRTTCNGSYYVGIGASYSKSACCENAKNDVHNQCNNYNCLGCCSLFSCDSICKDGDYFCTCSMRGQECSE